MTSSFSRMAQKVTDRIDQMSDKNRQSDNVHGNNYGPHSSNAANKVDPRVDSDRDGRNDPSTRVGGYGNTQGHNDGYSTTTGPGGIGASDTYSSNTNNPAYNISHSTSAGPHNSSMMNKLDPRVDSDRDGRNDPSSRVGGLGTNQHAHNEYNTASGPGGFGSSNTGHDNTSSYGGAHTGTHNTGLTTGTHNTGMPTGTHHTGSGYGASNTGMHTSTHNTSSGYGASDNSPAYNNPQSASAGPHNSNLMNKLDPRVDSDRDGRNDPTSRTGGYGQTQTGYGQSGYGQTESGHGTGVPSHTGIASAHHATTGHGHVGSNTTGYNNSQSASAGPHKSNLLNKLDPRVDSDRDGRNDPTLHAGGYGQTQTGYGSNTGAGYGTTTTTTTHPTTVTHTTHTTHAGHQGGAQGYGGANTGYDNAQSTTAGPHKSSLMNKLDPRVDSDRDGRDDPSSRVGGYGNTQTGAPKYY